MVKRNQVGSLSHYLRRVLYTPCGVRRFSVPTKTHRLCQESVAAHRFTPQEFRLFITANLYHWCVEYVLLGKSVYIKLVKHIRIPKKQQIKIYIAVYAPIFAVWQIAAKVILILLNWIFLQLLLHQSSLLFSWSQKKTPTVYAFTFVPPPKKKRYIANLPVLTNL